MLKVASDIRAAAIDEAESDVLFDEWLSTVGEGVAGYVTPKVAVAAVVSNERKEILLTQRADSGWWLYPVGWADVGYSASEIAMKEVLEETGIECEPVRLIGVLDGLRLGFARVPMYSIVFYCRMIGGELRGHPLETSAVGFFARDALPQPLAGAHRWLDMAFAAIDGEELPAWYDEPRDPPWRDSSVTVQLGEQERDDRDRAVRLFPRVADGVVVDEPESIGRAAELRGRRRSPVVAARDPLRTRRNTRARPTSRSVVALRSRDAARAGPPSTRAGRRSSPRCRTSTRRPALGIPHTGCSRHSSVIGPSSTSHVCDPFR